MKPTKQLLSLRPNKPAQADTQNEAAPVLRQPMIKPRGVVATIEDNHIVIRMPLFPPEKRKLSASGKSILCANTFGPKIARHVVDGNHVPIEIDGQSLRVIASAFIPAPDKKSVPTQGDEKHE